MKATLVRVLNDSGDRGSQRLYRCDPGGDLPEYVVVSAIAWPGSCSPGIWSAPFSHHGSETYIFAADEKGNVSNWTELPGSYKGGMSHEVALSDAGYEVDDVVATEVA